MNNIMLASFLGIPEMVLIFVVLLVMALMAATAAVLLVWLLRRHEGQPEARWSPQEGARISPGAASTCPRCGAPLPANSPQGLCPRCVMGVGLATHTEAPGDFGPHGTNVLKPVPSPEEIARHFPQLEIMECLGRGGMGVVYKARQPKLNRLVALKILAPERGADPKFAERFQREALALAKLSHPNIVTVHDFGEAEGMFYLLMEFVDGVSLRQTMREGRMKPEEALAIVPRICEALQFAHEQGVVHRDIKPENVLLDKQGRVKIADFGIAKLVGGSPLTPSFSPSGGERVGANSGEGALTKDQVLGTPHYMAPEQVERPQTVDHRADIYSLGVVFYEMLTGELPLGRFQPPSKKVQVDVRLDEVVLHTLEKEPERRYQHASEVKTDVERISGTPPQNLGAGDARPASGGAALPPLTPRQDASAVSFTAESVRTQFVIMAIAWWIGMPLSVVSELLPPRGDLVVGILCLPPLIVATVFWCILLYRHWSLLQGHGARTTPGKAVGFGFIPFYCFYWWFVAYAGLATDNNRYLDRAAIPAARMSRGLAITSCILGILGCTVGLIPIVGVAVWIPYMILSFIPALQQRNCVLAILQHRTGIPAGGNPPLPIA